LRSDRNAATTQETRPPVSATVSVSAQFGDTAGGPQQQVSLSIPAGVDATFALPNPSWDDECSLAASAHVVNCLWTPTGIGGVAVLLRADLTVGAGAPAGPIAVSASHSAPGSTTLTAPLLVTPAPTVTPTGTGTPTPTGTGTPTPTGTVAAIDPATAEPVPTAVPAGDAPLDQPGAGNAVAFAILGTLAALAGVGAFGYRRSSQRRH
jgi:hypothetical protein